MPDDVSRTDLAALIVTTTSGYEAVMATINCGDDDGGDDAEGV